MFGEGKIDLVKGNRKNKTKKTTDYSELRPEEEERTVGE